MTGFGTLINTAAVIAGGLAGSVLIFCVGVNIAFGKRIRVGNLLPALLVPVIYHISMVLKFIK